jgi:CRISPR-associated endonuclease Csn1
MIEAEFDALWAKQSELNPALFHDTARDELKDCLLHQRPLKPVKPGRCTLLPDEERAPLALPSQQRFRIYQEVNNLRLLREGLSEEPLTLSQRNQLANALETNSKRSYTQIQKLLGFSGQFNLQDEKRTELKGNSTSAMLSKKEFFGSQWFSFDEAQQDAIVMQLVAEENEARLIAWLQRETGVDEITAERIANVPLAEGYGSLSAKALEKILPALRAKVIT